MLESKKKYVKEWKPWPFEECVHCGSTGLVFTDADEGYAWDGDDVVCQECGCPGQIVVSGMIDDSAYVSWHDDPNCDCEWCKAHPDGGA